MVILGARFLPVFILRNQRAGMTLQIVLSNHSCIRGFYIAKLSVIL